MTLYTTLRPRCKELHESDCNKHLLYTVTHLTNKKEKECVRERERGRERESEKQGARERETQKKGESNSETK